MSVTSRTTMELEPASVTRARRSPADGGELQERLTGGTEDVTPGAGLGNTATGVPPPEGEADELAWGVGEWLAWALELPPQAARARMVTSASPAAALLTISEVEAFERVPD